MKIKQLNESGIRFTITPELNLYINPKNVNLKPKTKAVILNTNINKSTNLEYKNKDSIILNISGAGEFEINGLYIQAFTAQSNSKTAQLQKHINYELIKDNKKILILSDNSTMDFINKLTIGDIHYDLVLNLLTDDTAAGLLKLVEKINGTIFVYANYGSPDIVKRLKKEKTCEQTSSLVFQKKDFLKEKKHFILNT